MVLEAEKFRHFERTGWEKIPDTYHAAFGQLTTQAIEPLLDAARVGGDSGAIARQLRLESLTGSGSARLMLAYSFAN